MKYVIRAYEQSYGGLHGIEDWCAIESSDMHEVEQMASEMSIGVMESYSFIQEALDQQACFYAGCDMIDAVEDEVANEEFVEAREEAVNENVAFTIWEVDEECCGLSISEINHILTYYDPDGFVEEYCRIAVGC